MKPKKKTEKPTNGKTSSQLSHDEKVQEMVDRFTKKREDNEVDKYFRALVKLQGSDLHMKVGKAPIIRVNGTLCLLYTSPSPRDRTRSRMPSSA